MKTRKYILWCIIPIVNIGFTALWNYMCKQKTVPVHKQIFWGLLAGISCIPVVALIALISNLTNIPYFDYTYLYFVPMVLDVMLVVLGKEVLS